MQAPSEDWEEGGPSLGGEPGGAGRQGYRTLYSGATARGPGDCWLVSEHPVASGISPAPPVQRGRNCQLASCCRKGDPFQGPKLGSCLTLRNELSEETHVLTKQEVLLGRGARAESSRVGNPGGLLCHMARSLGFYDAGISFWVVFSQ